MASFRKCLRPGNLAHANFQISSGCIQHSIVHLRDLSISAAVGRMEVLDVCTLFVRRKLKLVSFWLRARFSSENPLFTSTYQYVYSTWGPNIPKVVKYGQFWDFSIYCTTDPSLQFPQTESLNTNYNPFKLLLFHMSVNREKSWLGQLILDFSRFKLGTVLLLCDITLGTFSGWIVLKFRTLTGLDVGYCSVSQIFHFCLGSFFMSC